MCDWRNGERNFMTHVRYCYPRTLIYLVIVTTMILFLMVYDLMGRL